MDLFVAAVALANQLSLHTYNASDFEHLGKLVEVVAPSALETS